MSDDLAILIPVYQEEDNILPLAGEVARALEGQPGAWEVLFIDDASTDRTWARIREAARTDARVRGLRHQFNAGQSAAFWTGLRATRSALVATLDGDRQNDPADLPGMLGQLAEADLVCGVRLERQDNWLRRLSTRVARRARRLVLGVDFRDTGCFLRVFRREALDGVVPFNGWHRFLPVLVHAAGRAVRETPVRHRPRVAGRSKYGVWNRLGRGLYDLIGVGWLLARCLRPIPTLTLTADAAEEVTQPDAHGGNTNALPPGSTPATPEQSSDGQPGRKVAAR